MKSFIINIVIFSLSILMLPAVSLSQETDTADRNRKEKTRLLLEELIKKVDSQKHESTTHHPDNFEISGMVIDNTKTKAGRDFYSLFYNHWISNSIKNKYIIKVNEEPFRLRSTKIEISVNDNIMFSSYLQPRQSLIENLAKQAYRRVKSYVQNYDIIMQQLDSPDTSGDGIY